MQYLRYPHRHSYARVIQLGQLSNKRNTFGANLTLPCPTRIFPRISPGISVSSSTKKLEISKSAALIKIFLKTANDKDAHTHH
jgi:hypothetical protein